MRPTNLRGRTFDYRDQQALLFNEDLEVPVCDVCGDLRLRGAQVSRFSAVMERLRTDRKQQAVREFVAMADEQFSDVPRYVWEDMLGLSRGYISRLESGTRTADTSLEILMQWVARDSAGALHMLADLGHLPAAVRNRLRSASHPAKVAV